MLESHSIANIFPMMDETTFAQFQADIKENTLQDRIIWLYEGKILDGRNRYRACEALKITYETAVYTGENPVAFVVSRNLHRRHLNESQRSMVGARISDLPQGGQHGNTQLKDATKSVTVGKDSVVEEVNLPIHPGKQAPQEKPPSKANQAKTTGVKQEKAAELLNVSTSSIKHAKKVQTEADPRVIAAVDAGKVAVSAAAKLADAPVSVQREVIAKVTQGEAKTISQAMKQVASQNGHMAAGPDILDDLKALRKLWEKIMTRWTAESDLGKIHDTLMTLAKYTMEALPQ